MLVLNTRYMLCSCVITLLYTCWDHPGSRSDTSGVSRLLISLLGKVFRKGFFLKQKLKDTFSSVQWRPGLVTNGVMTITPHTLRHTAVDSLRSQLRWHVRKNVSGFSGITMHISDVCGVLRDKTQLDRQMCLGFTWCFWVVAWQFGCKELQSWQGRCLTLLAFIAGACHARVI